MTFAVVSRLLLTLVTLRLDILCWQQNRIDAARIPESA
jgi:hypothetical protein